MPRLTYEDYAQDMPPLAIFNMAALRAVGFAAHSEDFSSQTRAVTLEDRSPAYKFARDLVCLDDKLSDADVNGIAAAIQPRQWLEGPLVLSPGVVEFGHKLRRLSKRVMGSPLEVEPPAFVQTEDFTQIVLTTPRVLLPKASRDNIGESAHFTALSISNRRYTGQLALSGGGSIDFANRPAIVTVSAERYQDPARPDRAVSFEYIPQSKHTAARITPVDAPSSGHTAEALNEWLPFIPSAASREEIIARMALTVIDLQTTNF